MTARPVTGLQTGTFRGEHQASTPARESRGRGRSGWPLTDANTANSSALRSLPKWPPREMVSDLARPEDSNRSTNRGTAEEHKEESAPYSPA
jgi:hypothetical protein